MDPAMRMFSREPDVVSQGIPKASASGDRRAMPLISVVLVNYKQWDHTERLASRLANDPLVENGRAEIVIVDNHSGPHKAVRSLRRMDGVSIRRWGKNKGFARAVNEGIRLSSGSWVLLLNPDMTALPGFLEAACAAGERLVAEDPRAGILGFGLLDSDGQSQSSTGPFPTLWSSLARLGLSRARRKYHMCQPGRGMVPWASGCCLLIRRDCLKDIGVLDPDFFLYYEDVDLCRRAWAKGWAVWHEPAVTLTHHCPLHLREVPAPLRVVTRHALLVYGHKHWPGWHNRILRLVIRTEIFWRQRWTTDLRSQASWKALHGIVSAIAGGDLPKSRLILEELLELSTNPYSKNVRAA
jgi:glycosyltransferase involved in cell wall biosynthesis